MSLSESSSWNERVLVEHGFGPGDMKLDRPSHLAYSFRPPYHAIVGYHDSLEENSHPTIFARVCGHPSDILPECLGDTYGHSGDLDLPSATQDSLNATAQRFASHCNYRGNGV